MNWGDHMNSTFGAKLAQTRKDKNISQKELAEKLCTRGISVTNQAISKWEKGSTQPNADQFLALCKALEIDDISLHFLGEESSLLHGLNAEGVQKIAEYADVLRASGMYTAKQEKGASRILPLYSMAVSAGTGQFLDSSDYENVEVEDEVSQKANFGVRVTGDSMMPRFSDGQIVWLQQQQTLQDGEIGVFLYDGDAYLKKLSTSNGRARLISLNPNYAPIEISEFATFRVLGKVLQ